MLTLIEQLCCLLRATLAYLNRRLQLWLNQRLHIDDVKTLPDVAGCSDQWSQLAMIILPREVPDCSSVWPVKRTNLDLLAELQLSLTAHSLLLHHSSSLKQLPGAST